MEEIKYHCSSPEEEMALDETLLSRAEQGRTGESLRFWESRDVFVSIGRAGRIDEECLLSSCVADGIKVIRRISGGGTVLQGPGCFNFSLILSYGRDEAYGQIISSYRSILGGISDELDKRGVPAVPVPISDITVGGRKISGNAQARKRSFFLHHGTFLIGFDIEKISRYIKHPPKEPEYRAKRLHEDFLANIQLPDKDIREAVRSALAPVCGEREIQADEISEMKDMAERKYKDDAWNNAF